MYILLAFQIFSIRLNYLLGVAVLLRFILIFVFPNLSDDIYRFIWDGNLIHAGYNPYSLLPSDALALNISGNNQLLFNELNSPEYFTVYPPFAQAIFYFSTAFSGDWATCSILMKSTLFMAEIGSIALILKILKQLNLEDHRVLIYALNPLILIELLGNLHFEAFTVFFVLLAFYWTIKQKVLAAATSLALGVCAKLLPLMLLPFIWNYFNKSKKLLAAFGVTCLLLFSPLFFGMHFSKFFQSVDLYFGKFEFNGGVYSLLRYIGFQLSGFNLIRFIGPLMAFITLAVMFRFFLKQRKANIHQLISFSFWSLTIYYLLSTTVHPWYLSLPLALSLFLPFRFILLWSFLIFFSYINYSYEPYAENLTVMFLEYLAVFGLIIYETTIRKKALKEHLSHV